MNALQPTPGEWIAAEEPTTVEGMGAVIVESVEKLIDGHPAMICAVLDLDRTVWPGAGSMEGNLRLILAGKKLLAAAKRAERIIQDISVTKALQEAIEAAEPGTFVDGCLDRPDLDHFFDDPLRNDRRV